jgi:hypothetical protein
MTCAFATLSFAGAAGAVPTKPSGAPNISKTARNALGALRRWLFIRTPSIESRPTP